MSALAPLVVAAGAVLSGAPSPTSTPIPAYTGDPNLITPGVVGFIAIFVIALATVFLLLDMNRRVRRTRYREMAREQIELERMTGADPSDAPGAPPRD